MNKILLIIQREYLSRVKKKAFIILTLLVPLLIIGMYALVYFLSTNGGDKVAQMHVIDQSGLFAQSFKDTKSTSFELETRSLDEAKKSAGEEDGGFLLIIPKDVETGGKPEILSKKKPGFTVISNIENQMNEILRTKMLKDAGIDQQTLNNIKPDVSIDTKELTEDGEKDSSAGAAMIASFAAAILIYMSLFIYGAQVMRGVIEEKSNRIIEVVISSVKPFQLMLGKIIGIGLVGLTQFMLWILLSAGLMATVGKAMMGDEAAVVKTEQIAGQNKVAQEQMKKAPGNDIQKAIDSIDFPKLLTVFLIYFLGGYMLYSALFAAVGSAVDTETETQQFMLPITMPLLFTYIMAFSFIINNPESTLSFWLSIIPFTSPVAMMVRIPFGVPTWQLALSIGLLVAGFIFTTWVAARIYRVGILMYGKKSSYKELAKWFFYKE